ncbi:Ras-specific guanine nucleotide-releasing factor RalGPS1, partial [Rhizoclosmatium hyalinum]
MDIIGRVKVMTKWFKVAVFLKKFNNFQGLKAVTSALNTPPITRLKKTWAHLRKKNANDLTEFEDLCALVSEQSNYSAYRQFIKTNQTRPIVPFLGVILHDVTYLMAVAKKESIDIVSDKRIQEIQKFIRYCSLGPRYSYEMLIDLDLAQSTAAGTSNLQKKGIKRRVQGGGLTEQGVETLGALFKDANEEEIGSFISHWLLTRKWVSEKEVDDMSASREPKVVKAPT